jgi:hypothetical protein
MPCKLTPVPDSPDFDGHTGQQVTIVTKNHIGTVLIAKAEYAGTELVPEGQALARVTFPIAPGRNTLKLVFVFTASTSGRGELREEAGSDSQFLRNAAGDEPFQVIKITGK